MLITSPEMKKLAYLFPALIIMIMATGCRDEDAGSDEMHADTTNVEAGADAKFIDHMVPHHRDAIHMADMVIKDGSDQKLKDMAQKMRADQQSDIDKMQSIRQNLSDPETEPEKEEMPVPMDSMMTLKGKDLDKAFLENMIPHHRQAIEMADEHQDEMNSVELKQMAQKMTETHRTEIEQMDEMLESMK